LIASLWIAPGFGGDDLKSMEATIAELIKAQKA
jgi:hypothetical protein